MEEIVTDLGVRKYKITGRVPELIEMYKRNECTVKELAKRFGISIPGVYYHIHKAKVKRTNH